MAAGVERHMLALPLPVHVKHGDVEGPSKFGDILTPPDLHFANYLTYVLRCRLWLLCIVKADVGNQKLRACLPFPAPVEVQL